MERLVAAEYKRIALLLKTGHAGGHHGVVFAVLEGSQAGEVLVDDCACLNAALVLNFSGFYFAFGTPPADFPNFIPELLSSHLTEEPTVLLAMSAAWQQMLDNCFAHKISRTAFAYPSSAPSLCAGWADRVPPGYRIARLDTELATQIEQGFGLDPWFLRIAGGAAAFVARHFGFVALEGERIVSMCASCGTGDGEVEMEVGTVKEFEGRGLATLVCCAFIEYCLSIGQIPGYTCATQNLASAAVARKLGFVRTMDVPGYPLHQSFTQKNGLWGE